MNYLSLHSDVRCDGLMRGRVISDYGDGVEDMILSIAPLLAPR